MNHHVFVNRVLNMKKIKLIGLDMDHTLIRYNTEKFEALVYKMVVERLISEKGYPESIQSLKFNAEGTIRGLIIDKKNGNILKLSRFGAIRQSYHGTKSISYLDQKTIYRSTYVDLNDPNYTAIDTSFSIAFCLLYSQLVDLKDQYPKLYPDYEDLASDVLNTVDGVHADGSLKGTISKNLDAYVFKDPLVVEGLKRYRQYGKRIFILTNSEFYYTKLLLDYAINPFLAKGETWSDLFEFVITLANKPRFFYDNLKFLKIDAKTGMMMNLSGKLTPGIYQGGCAHRFTDDLAVSGHEILYIGDHIYGDIVRLKKDCNWRTALVVDELGKEIEAQKKAQPVATRISASMKIKIALEEKYVELVSHDLETHSNTNQLAAAEQQQKITAIDIEISDLLKTERQFYNKNWGRIFRAGAEESYFAYQVERYACIYMEKISDLFSLSPISYFRASRRSLAHDLEMDGIY